MHIWVTVINIMSCYTNIIFNHHGMSSKLLRGEGGQREQEPRELMIIWYLFPQSPGSSSVAWQAASLALPLENNGKG